MKKLWRVIVAVLIVYAAVMALMSVQYFFDRGDLKKAAAVIYQYKLPSHPEKNLLELMASDLNVNPDRVHCETELLSRYEGRVLIECGAQARFKKHDSGNNHEWVVDVVLHTVQAHNDKAKKLGLETHD